MRILLINPPSPAGETINREGAAGLGNRYASAGAFLYPPQTLATAAAILRQAGCEPALLDATAEGLSLAQALARLAESAPHVAVVQLSWSGWQGDLAFCAAVRDAQPALPLVTLGAVLRQPAYVAEAALVSDLALVGEPERALPAAVRAVERGAGAGRSVSVAELAPADYDAAGYLVDLEALPLPAWDLAPLGRYRMATLLSSRGCGERCAYCPYVLGWGPRVRACSPRRTVDELAWLARTFRPARLLFRDPVFACDRQRVLGICQEIAARRLDVAWECESRPEHCDPELLRLMRRAGCATLKLGLESGSPERLLRMGRLDTLDAAHAYLARSVEIARTCRQIGLRLHLFLLAGWPDAGQDEIAATERLLRQIEPAHLTIKPVESYPGTPWTAAGRAADAPRAAQEIERLMACIRPEAQARSAWIAKSSGSSSWWRRALAWARRKMR